VFQFLAVVQSGGKTFPTQRTVQEVAACALAAAGPDAARAKPPPATPRAWTYR